MDKQVRALVWERSKGLCEKCGLGLSEDGWAFHHRLLRKHGGMDSPENGLAVHHGCHNGDTYSIHLNPRVSYERGWLVRRGVDPGQAPLRLPGGRLVLLTGDGAYKNLVGNAGVIITDELRF